jgi:hypothetical protein
MKTLTTLTLTGALALLSVPAFADDSTPTVPSAEQQCRTMRSEMGVELFRQAFGTNKNRHNAFGKCVSKREHATEDAREEATQNASQACKTEEAADPAAFAEKYGTGKNKRNAHGKCVSQQAKSEAAETVDDEVDAHVDAAASCKAERKADPDAFREKYGTNRNQRNAFGKCVSKQAREDDDA